MNCKPGDLAVIVGGTIPKLIGAIVTIRAKCWVHEKCWLTDPPLYVDGFTHPCSIRDETLRPIRDNDGTDETLTWAGKPEGVTA